MQNRDLHATAAATEQPDSRCNGLLRDDELQPANEPVSKGIAVQEPFRKELLAGRTTVAAWRSKPSFYAVSTEDRTIDADLERFMAKRMGAKTIEVKASHLSMISQPETIANLILEAAGRS